MQSIDELPTLRLVTLRRLVRRTVPPIVFDQKTPIGVVGDILAQIPDATAVLIDGSRVYQGTLRLHDLSACDRTSPAEQVMSILTPVLLGEEDIDAAQAAMSSSDTDRVLVIAPDGELLGVLTDRDLADRKRAA